MIVLFSHEARSYVNYLSLFTIVDFNYYIFPFAAASKLRSYDIFLSLSSIVGSTLFIRVFKISNFLF